MAKEKPANQVTTGKVRFSYVHIFEKHAFDSDPSKEQYSLCVLIPKDDKKTLASIARAIETAKEIGKPKMWDNKIPAKLWNPLRDGDEEHPEDEAFEGHYFLNAKSNTKPGIVDRNLERILDPEEVYSGCYGRVSLTFFPFNSAGNRGVGVGLNNVQKVADGERLGGRSNAEDDFEEYDDEDIDDLLG